jgi:flagellar basal body-associated protein FliL
MTAPARLIRAPLLVLAAVFATASLFPAGAAQAAEAKEKAPAGDILTVEIPGLIVPVAQGNALQTYVFLTLEVRAGDFASAEHMRQRLFLVRDSIVRATSTAPAQVGAQAGTFDSARLIPVLAGAIARSGPRVRVQSVRIKEARFMRG